MAVPDAPNSLQQVASFGDEPRVLPALYVLASGFYSPGVKNDLVFGISVPYFLEPDFQHRVLRVLV